MKKIKPYLLIAPIVFLGILFIFGVGNALVQSLGYIPAFSMTELTLQYYIELFEKPTLLASVGISLYISVVSSLLATVLGVCLSAALFSGNRIRKRTLQIIKVPLLVPHTVTALFVILFFSQSGIVARTAAEIGLISGPEDFPALLFSPNSFGIIAAYLWKESPFVAYFVLTAMANVSATLGEAAENLGASRRQAFVKITLPLCMPSILKAFIILFAYSFGAYELPFLLGATLPKALPVQAYIEYVDPDLLHRPYAMAMNGIMLVIGLVLAAVYYRMLRKNINRLGEGHYYI